MSFLFQILDQAAAFDGVLLELERALELAQGCADLAYSLRSRTISFRRFVQCAG